MKVSTKVYGSAESKAGIGGGGDGKLTLAKNAAFEEAKQPIGDIHDRADAHEVRLLLRPCPPLGPGGPPCANQVLTRSLRM